MKNENNGQTPKEIGKLLGIPDSTVRNISKCACRNLKRSTAVRLQHMLRQTSQPPVVCSIFAMGTATCETLSSFEQAALFLIKTYYVTQFHVASEYCYSEYMSVLNRISQSYPHRNIQITAITHYPEITTDDWRNISSRFIPPCHSVKNINTHAKRIRAKVLRTTKAMIEQSDFCICNLFQDSLAENIKKHLSKVKGTKVFDISKTFTGTK